MVKARRTRNEGRVRALVTVAGNPVLSNPDSDRLDRALASLEFMVSVDPYLNETTRHADVILPPPPPLERSHYDLAFYTLSVRNIANWSPALIDNGSMPEEEILARLTLIASGLGADADPAIIDEMVQRADTRFLIITHHAVTMSRMDRLFGVTMQERGVSQLVSVDLETAEQLRDAG